MFILNNKYKYVWISVKEYKEDLNGLDTVCYFFCLTATAEMTI